MTDLQALKEMLALWLSLDIKDRLRDEGSKEWQTAFESALRQIEFLARPLEEA